MLLVDREPQKKDARAGYAVAGSGWTSTGFVGDHFKLGALGEVWIIDTIRAWVVRDAASRPSARLRDHYTKAVLFGGIEATPRAPGQPPEPECDCHNLMAIQTIAVGAGAEAASAVRQLDFKEVHWSVPGGVMIQFGIMGVAGGARTDSKGTVWRNSGVPDGAEHQLKQFDDKGKLLGPYAGDGGTPDKTMGIGVQVWGHLMANLAIRSVRPTIEAVLRGSDTFDVRQTDLASLRFGPKGAAPVSSKLVSAEGKTNLELKFRAVDAGLLPITLTACVLGRQQSGVQFEACDAVTTLRPAK